jgi:hypothetical protein
MSPSTLLRKQQIFRHNDWHMKAATLSAQDFEGYFAKRLSAVECRFFPTSGGSQSEIFASLTSIGALTQPDQDPTVLGE